MKTIRHLAAAFVLVMSASGALAKDLTLCWAAWDPAYALVELSKDFEAQSGHRMEFVLTPWPDYAERMQTELAAERHQCDLMMGEPHWIRAGGRNDQLLNLNDVLDSAGINLDDFSAARIFATGAAGAPEYYALPAMVDAIGWVYRKDWFDDPDVAAAYKTQTGRDLVTPASQLDLLQIARFFQGRTIKNRPVYGAAVFSGRGGDAISTGSASALFPWGVAMLNGVGSDVIDRTKAIAALGFFKALYVSATPPDRINQADSLDAFKSGQVAMAMTWFSHFPGLNADPTIGDRTGYFANPPELQPGSVLGGYGLGVVAKAQNRNAALDYVKWFATPAVQTKWRSLGGFSTHRAVLGKPGGPPFAKAYGDAMDGGRAILQHPERDRLVRAMQTRLHDFVVRDQGTAKEALDKLIADWTDILKTADSPTTD